MVWLDSDATNYLNWQFAGDRALELAAKAERSQISPAKYLEEATGFYRVSVALYPTNGQLHLQLASVLAIQDQWDEAQTERSIAVQLSNDSPHLDKKLTAQQIWLPLKPPVLERILAEENLSGGGWYPAEPIASWIRNSRDTYR